MYEGLTEKDAKIARRYENMTDAEVEASHEWAVKNGLSFSGPGALEKAVAAAKTRLGNSAKFRATARKPYTFRLHSGAVDVIKAFAERYGGHYQSLVDDAVVELAERLEAEMPRSLP